jgi:hypothetical protein
MQNTAHRSKLRQTERFERPFDRTAFFEERTDFRAARAGTFQHTTARSVNSMPILSKCYDGF